VASIYVFRGEKERERKRQRVEGVRGRMIEREREGRE